MVNLRGIAKSPDYTVAMRVPLLALFALYLPAQDSMPARPGPAEYQAHTAVGGHILAAEFQGRTVPAPGAAFVLQHYVVVEAGVFPAKPPAEFTFHSGRFSLRLNGKTAALAQTPGMVAASLKYPSWENQRRMTAEAGIGNAGVILGRDTTPRFPGDRRAPVPPPGTPARVETETAAAPWDWVAKLAFDDGPVKGPSGGLLYFPYNGNLAKLKTIELIYNDDGRIVTWTLRGPGAAAVK